MKLITPVKIGVLPGDRRYLFGGVRALRIADPFLVLQEPREDRGIVKNDTVSCQAATFRPKVLLILSLEAQFAEAGEGNSPPELVVVTAFCTFLRTDRESI